MEHGVHTMYLDDCTRATIDNPFDTIRPVVKAAVEHLQIFHVQAHY